MWADKRYHSLDYEMKARYGHKIYKIALDGGFTCPNRDGLIDTRGCIFAALVVLVILLLQDSFLSQIKSRKVSSFCLASNKFLNAPCYHSLTFRHLPALMIPSSASDSLYRSNHASGNRYFINCHTSRLSFRRHS